MAPGPLNYLPKLNLMLGLFWASSLPCFCPPSSLPRGDLSRQALGIFTAWSWSQFNPMSREIPVVPSLSLSLSSHAFVLGVISSSDGHQQELSLLGQILASVICATPWCCLPALRINASSTGRLGGWEDVSK